MQGLFLDFFDGGHFFIANAVYHRTLADLLVVGLGHSTFLKFWEGNCLLGPPSYSVFE